jgi:exopolysaccharide biosynthesis polyprenyl glycosylphosphotransferase
VRWETLTRPAPPAALPAADGLALAAAIAVTGTAGWPAAGYAIAVLAVLAASGQHRLKVTPRVSDQAARIAVAAMLPVLIVLPWITAGPAVRLALISAGVVTCVRAIAYRLLRAAHRRGALADPAVIVGTGETAAELAAAMCSHPELGLRLAGLIADQPGVPAVAGLPLPVLGRTADLARVIRGMKIRRVIVASGDEDSELIPALRSARELPVDICVVPRLAQLGSTVSRTVQDEIWGIPLIPLRRIGAISRLAKRAFDVCASLALLVLLGPVIVVFGMVTSLQLRRPALFLQVRVTGTGRTAEIIKLRTLGSHGNPDTCWVVPVQRLTTFGRFLRTTHLDELPQLFNVVCGHMSLVGPRPERPYFARRFEQEIPGYADRHRVNAGLTGWAQVHGLNGDTSIRERARFDNAYIENWSLWLDIVIIARTVAAALAGAAVHRASGVPRADLPTATGSLASASHFRPVSLQGDQS